MSDYVKHVVSTTDVRFDGLSIALDCANGSASVCAKEIFTSLGAKCLMLSDTPDGTKYKRQLRFNSSRGTYAIC